MLIDDAARTLRAAGVASPDVDAKILAAHLLGVSPLQLTFVSEAPEDFQESYGGLVDKRAARVPLQHVIGVAPFGPLELEVGPGVFIPRPETEVLADWAVRALTGAAAEAPVVVDLGTGSGALALYVLHHVPNARVVAVERSRDAIAYAKRNGQRLGLDIEVVEGDITDPALLPELAGRVDLVVSNPPYVPDTDDLDPEVYADPREAVFSGADGMEAIRGLVPVAAQLLAPGGKLGIEHDDTTSDDVLAVVEGMPTLSGATVLHDMTGRARFVTASKLTA
ncbi:peptide chain release factor N(5)-glutamine methyltransferase [Corynebacterium aquatimens]|uniref:Release factor glutamine methyltransferase n=1 Tax=Corynebacterium aquatimens TaxID=1190508 RepID=A0A931E2L4_9CORY|nr:peptide chain release factor N(5)-glutamine methyltransferase [Corynebacterium aquatimens]MBG6121368.1 release factor glutamine methyltransferase [Corynebacterium aquatimens]WJY66088.1 Release factor glutamine methyltransferase [Corynebacterium aquatimens]